MVDDIAGLVAEARREGSPDAWPLGVHYKPLLVRLADALESVDAAARAEAYKQQSILAALRVRVSDGLAHLLVVEKLLLEFDEIAGREDEG